MIIPEKVAVFYEDATKFWGGPEARSRKSLQLQSLKPVLGVFSSSHLHLMQTSEVHLIGPVNCPVFFFKAVLDVPEKYLDVPVPETSIIFFCKYFF